jgi:hypothetical protein
VKNASAKSRYGCCMQHGCACTMPAVRDALALDQEDHATAEVSGCCRGGRKVHYVLPRWNRATYQGNERMMAGARATTV